MKLVPFVLEEWLGKCTAAERGVLVAPGCCFGAPAHFRIGFGLAMPRYGDDLAGWAKL